METKLTLDRVDGYTNLEPRERELLRGFAVHFPESTIELLAAKTIKATKAREFKQESRSAPETQLRLF